MSNAKSEYISIGDIDFSDIGIQLIGTGCGCCSDYIDIVDNCTGSANEISIDSIIAELETALSMLRARKGYIGK